MSDIINILVVEDDKSVSEYIKTLLESFISGKIEIVSNAEDAINYTIEQQPNIVLMDIVLEGNMDGIEAATIIKKNSNTPIVYLTAYEDEDFLQRAQITDPFAYMLKPIQLRELQAVVMLTLQKHKNNILLQHDAYITNSLKKLYHPLLIVDKDLNVTSINEAMSKLLVINENDIISQSYENFFKIYLNDNLMKLDNQVLKAKASDGLYKEEEAVIMELPNGGSIPISVTFSLIKNDFNELDGISIMIVDLTQQTIEKNLLHKKQLEAAELLIRERRLKEILDIGKDINQSLIHPTAILDRLDSAVNRIVQFSNFKIAHIAIEESGVLITRASSRNSLLYINYEHEIPRSDHFLERLYNCVEKGVVDLWEIRDSIYPSIFNNRAENIPIKSLLMLPLNVTHSETALGVMSIASSDEKAFDIDIINYFEEFANDIALAIALQRKRDEVEALKLHREKNYEQTILAFVQMIEERDIYTRGHSERVAKYSKAIAQEMNLDNATCTRVYRAAILHDIGKIHTPDKILLKPDNLADEEYQLVKEHANAGVRVLKPIDMYGDIINIIAQHHEYYNGKGYPRGLKENELELLARIMSIADAFDAMTTNRIYRKRLTAKEAIEELKKEAGKQFDPDIIKVAVKILPKFTIPKVNQIPTTEVEKERMAYYYRDPLTHLYNEEYLFFYLQDESTLLKYQYLNIYSLSGLQEYNAEHGWCLGNDKLAAISKIILEENKKVGSICFRVHGNKFLIFTQTSLESSLMNKDCEALLKNTSLSIHKNFYKLNDFSNEIKAKEFDTIIHKLMC